MTTLTTGTPAKASEVNANFAAIKTAIEGIPSEKAWRLIAETDITSNTTSYTFSGLNGDSDVEYRIVARYVNQIGALSDYWLSLNGDVTGGNYGYCLTYGSNGGTAINGCDGSISGAIITCSQVATGGVCMTEVIFYAKSGYKRIAILNAASYTSTSSYWHARGFANWNNTG